MPRHGFIVMAPQQTPAARQVFKPTVAPGQHSAGHTSLQTRPRTRAQAADVGQDDGVGAAAGHACAHVRAAEQRVEHIRVHGLLPHVDALAAAPVARQLRLQPRPCLSALAPPLTSSCPSSTWMPRRCSRHFQAARDMGLTGVLRWCTRCAEQCSPVLTLTHTSLEPQFQLGALREALLLDAMRQRQTYAT